MLNYAQFLLAEGITMNIIKRFTLLTLVLSSLTTLSYADNITNPTANAGSNPPNGLIPITVPKPLVTPSAPAVRAKGYILMDANSGRILASQNPDLKLPPASLTKMMTSYIVSSALQSGRIHLDDKVLISEKAWRTGGSKMFVKVGDSVPVRDLLQGIIVASGNDACVAMAEHLAGSEETFANLMNQQAKALGMNNSHFMDTNGLPDPQHYTTPYDMAILARAIIFNFPEDYKWYSQKEFTYNKIKQSNRNRLLWRDSTVDGLKTGHTDEAGYCLVASAQRNNMRLISVVMGAPSDSVRNDDSQKLLGYGFRFFETHKLYAAGTVLNKARVYLGDKKYIPVGVDHEFYVTIPNGQGSNVKTNIVLNNSLQAPLRLGQAVGTIQVVLNNQIVTTRPIVTLEADALGGFFSRLIDYIQMTLHHLLGGDKT